MTVPEARKFVLQGFDPTTGNPRVECRVFIRDIAKIQEILGSESSSDTNITNTYYVDADEMVALGQICEPAGLVVDLFTAIAPWHSIRDVPYLVHTGFELSLMLEQRKPMAMFCDIPSQWFREYLAPFEPFVASAQIIRREFQADVSEDKRISSRSENLVKVYFALPGEEWRIDAHLALQMVADKTGWNDSLERFEGSLLGYEDWQNDWWIEHRTMRPK